MNEPPPTPAEQNPDSSFNPSAQKENRLSRFFSNRKAFYLSIALVLIVVGALGGVLYKNHKQKPAVTQTYSYTYNKLETYKIPGAKTGTGISFSKPTQYIGSPTSNPQEDQAYLTQGLYKNNKLVLVGLSSAQTTIPATDNVAALLGIMAQTYNHPSASDTSNLMVSLKSYASKELGADGTLQSVSSLNKLTSTNIQNSAWYIDFTATPKRVGDPNYKGKVVYAIGKKAFYYFMIDNVSYNWDNKDNQKVWQQVINSLKIDQ